MNPLRFLFGLDLGQAVDPSAMCLLEQTAAKEPDGRRAFHYGARYLQRWPLGTSYPDIVADVGQMLREERFWGSTLAIDATGCGRPVYDLFHEAGLPVKLMGVLITGGAAENYTDGLYHVAKVILISGLQVALQKRRLKFAAGLKDVATLIQELRDYRVKITAAEHEVFSAREGAHDDLLLSLAIAVWAGQKDVWQLTMSLDDDAPAGRGCPAARGYPVNAAGGSVEYVDRATMLANMRAQFDESPAGFAWECTPNPNYRPDY